MTDEPFNFWNDRKAYELEGFVSCLDEISDEEFASYVNVSKNDFANWIEYSLQNVELGEKVKSLLERDLIKEAVSSFINSKQNKLIVGTTKAIQDDSLVKEVIQKNENFVKNSNDEKRVEALSLKSEKGSAEKGSKLSLIDFPQFKKAKGSRISVSDFVAGLIFGLMLGILITLIVLQLI